jgi:hypothetical protein
VSGNNHSILTAKYCNQHKALRALIDGQDASCSLPQLFLCTSPSFRGVDIVPPPPAAAKRAVRRFDRTGEGRGDNPWHAGVEPEVAAIDRAQTRSYTPARSP